MLLVHFLHQAFETINIHSAHMAISLFITHCLDQLLQVLAIALRLLTGRHDVIEITHVAIGAGVIQALGLRERVGSAQQLCNLLRVALLQLRTASSLRAKGAFVASR